MDWRGWLIKLARQVSIAPQAFYVLLRVFLSCLEYNKNLTFY
jgi:hypothetical protein